MPRPRFTIRRLVVAIALLAALLGGGRAAIRGYQVYRIRSELAATHLRQADANRAVLPFLQEDAKTAEELAVERARAAGLPAPPEGGVLHTGYRYARTPLDLAIEAAWNARSAQGQVLKRRLRAEHHEALARKYAEAARSPWSDVPPDPSDPSQ